MSSTPFRPIQSWNRSTCPSLLNSTHSNSAHLLPVDVCVTMPANIDGFVPGNKGVANGASTEFGAALSGNGVVPASNWSNTELSVPPGTAKPYCVMPIVVYECPPKVNAGVVKFSTPELSNEFGVVDSP